MYPTIVSPSFLQIKMLKVFHTLMSYFSYYPKVATDEVARMLVDTSNSIYIIFKSTLDQLLIEL